MTLQTLEAWAKDISDEAKKIQDPESEERLKAADIAVRITLIFLAQVEERLALPVPSVWRPLWEKALEWQQVAIDLYGDHLEPEPGDDGVSTNWQEPYGLMKIQEKIDQLRPRVDDWIKQHSQKSGQH